MLEVVDITHVRVVGCAICPTHAARCHVRCLTASSTIPRTSFPRFMPRPLMRISAINRLNIVLLEVVAAH